MLIIAFGHKARRGKNSVANAIIAARGGRYDIRSYALADKLKQEVNEAAIQYGSMYGLITEMKRQGKLPDWVKYDPDPDMTDPLCPMGKQRTLLQWWGSEFRRAQNPFYWIKGLFRTFDAEKPQVALVTDMRFFNEMYAFKSPRPDRIGFCVRLDRIGFKDTANGTNSEHHSENELDEAKVDGRQYDYAIEVADGNLEELEKDAVILFDMIVDSLTPPPPDAFTLEAMEQAAASPTLATEERSGESQNV